MPNEYIIPRRILSHIAKDAEKADIHELCYIVFGKGSKIKKVIPIPNRADNTVLHHEIWNKDYSKILKRKSVNNLHCLGILHTHPISIAYPGKGDISGYKVGTLIFIYSDIHEELRAFRITNHHSGYIEKKVVIE